MRTKTFEIGGDMIAPFFGFLDSTMLQVNMVEINEEQEIVTEIGYTEDDKEAMMDLIELYDELIEAREQAEALDEDDDDDDEEEEDDLGCLDQDEEKAKAKRRTNRKATRKK